MCISGLSDNPGNSCLSDESDAESADPSDFAEAGQKFLSKISFIFSEII